jgi:hypothetical protein
MIAVDTLHPLVKKVCCLTVTGYVSNFPEDLRSADPD